MRALLCGPASSAAAAPDAVSLLQRTPHEPLPLPSVDPAANAALAAAGLALPAAATASASNPADCLEALARTLADTLVAVSANFVAVAALPASGAATPPQGDGPKRPALPATPPPDGRNARYTSLLACVHLLGPDHTLTHQSQMNAHCESSDSLSRVRPSVFAHFHSSLRHFP